jgi:hypothetical protein
MNFLEYMGLLLSAMLIITIAVAVWSLVVMLSRGTYQWLRIRAVAKRRGLGHKYTFLTNAAAIISLSLSGYDVEIDNAIIVPYLIRKKLRKVAYPFA